MSLPITFDKGLNTAKDPSQLDNGEMVQATGVVYRPGDQRAHKIGGVTTFADTGSSKRIDGVALLQYDTGGTDKVVALSDKVLYSANLSNTGATGTITTLKSGLGSLATSLSAAQFNDKQYLAVGSENLAVKSDGTTHAVGMKGPTGTLTGVAGLGTILIRAASDAGVFTNGSSAYDTDLATYAHSTLSTAGSVTERFSWSGTSNTGTSRVLEVKWALTGFPAGLPDWPSDGDFDDVGTTFDSGYRARVKFEISEDGGLTFTEVMNKTRTQATGEIYAQFDITDTTDIDGNLILKATLQYVSGDADASLNIYDVNVNDGGTASNFTTKVGFYYGVAEFDENEGDPGPAIFSPLIQMTGSVNNVLLTLPTSANSRATHWRIYRTTDGGSLPATLGLISSDKPISATTFLDTFPKFDIDDNDQALPFLPLLRTLAQQDVEAIAPLYFQQNHPPRRMIRFRVFEGSLVGLSADNTRAMYYSMAGKPQSWPEINVIESFPFEEHDELVDCVSLGSILLVAAKGLMMRLTGLPRVVNSSQDRSRVEPLQGAPGCVGRYALTAFSVQGESRAAWISPYGVYATNGDSSLRISDSIDWTIFDGIDKSKWVLHWDANRLALVMSTGSSDGKYYLIHMAPEHRKDGQQPKWTGPHYGSFNGFSSGQVGSTHRLYGGHSSNGIVYVLDRGGIDTSQAFSGTQLPLKATSGKAYAGDRDWAALDAQLFHTDFGAGETCTLDWEVGDDNEVGGGFVHSQSVSLEGHKGTQLDLSQRGQWAQATITHTGSGQGAIRDLVVETAARGRTGSKRVA